MPGHYGDQSTFSGNTDTFVDIAIPWHAIITAFGLPGGTTQVLLGSAAGTSNTDINYNKDKPDGGWTDTVILVIPEPASAALLAMGGLLALRRRPRSRRVS